MKTVHIFSKVFKKAEGITPEQYRKGREKSLDNS